MSLIKSHFHANGKLGILLSFFVQAQLVVGLIKVLFDVLVLIGDLSPNVYLFGDAQDALFLGNQVLAEVVVKDA